MNKQIKIALLVVSFARVMQIFLDYNYDWPDQYWQGPQIAYKFVNQYGFQTWQWTMQQPLRNPLYQLYLSLAYWLGNLLEISSLHKEYLLKFMQVLIAVLSDIFLIKTALRYTTKLTIGLTIFILTNWYYFTMMNRTYINSVEASLTIIAFYFWLTRQQSKKNDLISRLAVALCFMMRTTSIIIWAVIWPYQLLFKQQKKIRFIVKNIFQLIMMALLSLVFNSWWFGKPTFIEFNFFKYNILLNWSSLYGVSSYLYYFYAVIPLIMGGYLVPLILSLKCFTQSDVQEPKQAKKTLQDKRLKELFILVLAMMLILSLSQHKQSRFLLVIAPFLLILTLKGISMLQTKSYIINIIILINLSFFFVCAIYGKSGGIKILRSLRDDIHKNYPNQEEETVILYLCQPHSLPLYSILQKNITVKILDTSPLRKIQHFNQEEALKTNAQALYTQLIEGEDSKKIIYVIIQEKYSISGNYFNEQYQFLLHNHFEMIASQRNVNLWQQYSSGWDGFLLLRITKTD